MEEITNQTWKNNKAEIIEALKAADTEAMTNSRMKYAVVVYDDNEVKIREQLNGDSFRIVEGAETVKVFAYREDLSPRKAKSEVSKKADNGEYDEIYRMWNDYKA